MRLRTFVLLILVLFVLALAVILIFANISGGGPLANLLPGLGEEAQTATEEPAGEEPGLPPAQPLPTATPALLPVVVARIDLPVGERLRSDLLAVEMRPDNNIALQGGYTFSDPEELIGQIIKVPVDEGQAILRPMIALNPSDLASFGSDLGLYVNRGNVAIAFPIDRYSGAAFAMRPGDLMDVMMTLSLVELDQEFRTALPNLIQRVDEDALLEGSAFLFEPSLHGRLELIPELNVVAEIIPGSIEGQEEPGAQIPRRVTQLAIQQAEVLWVGTWRDPLELQQAQEEAAAAAAASEAPLPTPTPLPERLERNPDLVILSMPLQDALVLKWALEVGINTDLALRAQGDSTVFVTTSVTLPQIIEQGGLIIPEVGQYGLEPPVDEVPVPAVPPEPPTE